MNRKSKIIVSVVGITIVLLALLGITYAYYLTRIQGNTYTNSISVTTADLKLVYGDGNGLVTANDIMPGTTITKEFTVTNSGNSKVNGYVVVLENIENTLTRTDDLVYTLTCKLNDSTSCGFTEEVVYPHDRPLSVIFTNDIETETTHNYTLTVTYKNLTDIDQSDDMGKTFSGKVNIYDANQVNPYTLTETSNNDTSLTYNIINNAKTNANGTTFRTTPLTVPAKEITATSNYIQQPIDMSSYLTYTPIRGYNYYYSDKYQMNSEGRFILMEKEVLTYNGDITPLIGKYITSTYSGEELLGYGSNNLYKVLESTTSTSLKYVKVNFEETTQKSLENTLSITQDNLGTSYYFRGHVQDNYVIFNNMCWNIVRIAGDGSIKLIYAGKPPENTFDCLDLTENSGLLTDENDEIIHVEYSSPLVNYENYEGGLEDTLENWFTTNFSSNLLKEKIKEDKWCLGGIAEENRDEIEEIIIYPAGNRLYNETNLLCENEDYVISKYGTITSDEAMLAGASYQRNIFNYLSNNAANESYWTLSYGMYDWDGGWDDMAIPNDTVIYMTDSGGLSSMQNYPEGANAVRPMITLVPGVTIRAGGNGTVGNPYVID